MRWCKNLQWGFAPRYCTHGDYTQLTSWPWPIKLMYLEMRWLNLNYMLSLLKRNRWKFYLSHCTSGQMHSGGVLALHNLCMRPTAQMLTSKLFFLFFQHTQLSKFVEYPLQRHHKGRDMAQHNYTCWVALMVTNYILLILGYPQEYSRRGCKITISVYTCLPQQLVSLCYYTHATFITNWLSLH